jgi:hypothetical protein
VKACFDGPSPGAGEDATVAFLDGLNPVAEVGASSAVGITVIDGGADVGSMCS